MPIWPFRKRRRSVSKDEASQPLTEKALSPRAATYSPPTSTPPIPIPRKSSKRGTLRRRRQSQADDAADVRWTSSEKPQTPSNKENAPPPSRARASSREDITALPMSRTLESSPHLRPVDFEKPPIPYNFRNYTGSQSSLHRDSTNMSYPPRAGTLRSRRSGYDSAPSRMSSARRRKDDHLREEEIRAMSAQASIPKRPGDGPLRRDSKKLRGSKDSTVSLPVAEDSILSMSAILEQRGWEIGSIDVFNPRPAVRLSGTPQYVTPGSLPNVSAPLSPTPMRKDKEKAPASRSSRKRETIGNRADDLDAGDIRLLMERDAKRREARRKEQQEKLDKKLRSRGGRNRGDSDRRRREAEEVRRAEEAKQRTGEENGAMDAIEPPSAIHAAQRGASDTQPVGLGIVEDHIRSDATEAEGQRVQTPMRTPEDTQTDPFADPVVREGHEISPTLQQNGTAVDHVPESEDVQMQDTPTETAQELPMSQVATPPLSPVQRSPNGPYQAMDPRGLSDIPIPPQVFDQRRVSDPRPERRAGAWATFFRRGGSKLQRADDDKSASAEVGFSNTSRETMRNQPLPPHLIDTSVQQNRKSGTPVRTQSKFREDLPELPISPPDSRLPSPDVTTAAAAAAAARRAARSTAQAQDVSMTESTRNDTPVTPRQHRITSMASIDSEGSWLASGSAKRTSTQSALPGRRQDFSNSYEELGGDRDAEYINRPNAAVRKMGSSVLAGADPAEESGEDEDQIESSDPMTMHESVRRHPTLVHRDPRVKSREGLLTEYSADDNIPIPTSAGTGSGSLDFDSDEPEPELQRASSVGYGMSGKGHARHVSAGSAKLFQIGPRSPTSQPRTTEDCG